MPFRRSQQRSSGEAVGRVSPHGLHHVDEGRKGLKSSNDTGQRDGGACYICNPGSEFGLLTGGREKIKAKIVNDEEITKTNGRGRCRSLSGPGSTARLR